MNPLQFEQPVKDAGGWLELLVAATGRDLGRPQWRRSPQDSIPESIDRGVLPNIRFRMLPGDGVEVYSSGTEEAWKQFCEAYFAQSTLLQQAGEPQAWERNALIAVPPKITREYAHRLQQQFLERGLPGKVLCFDGKTGPDKEALQLWFSNQADNPRQLPHVIVTAPTHMKLAFDLQNIEMGIALAPMTADDLLQFFGRLTHTARHRSGAPFSALFWQQLLRDMKKQDTLPRILDEQGRLHQQRLPWANDRRVLSVQACQTDAALATGSKFRREQGAIPETGAARKKLDRHFGTPLESTAARQRARNQALRNARRAHQPLDNHGMGAPA